MVTIGIDFAASDIGTVACIVEWGAAKAFVLEIQKGLSNESFLALIRSTRATKVGIDVPFGWPDEFVDAVYSHKNGGRWPAVDRKLMQSRQTDRFVREKSGKKPLGVSCDRIAVTAMRAAGLFSKLFAQKGEIDRSGSGELIEVYPAAALKIWGFAHESYKGRKNEENRRRLVQQFESRTSRWLDFKNQRKSCIEDDNAFDSLLSAVIARAAAIGKCEPIPKEIVAQASREGWIALPIPGSLDLLI